MKAVVTDPKAVLTLDLYTAKPSDTIFRTPFSIPARRNDFIHAIIAWFDIDFSACHKPIRFTTGPHAKYTHWKQTVFYLTDAAIVKEGECIVGELKSKPSEKNRRDLDITLSWKLDTADTGRAVGGKAFYKM